jgi:type III pantothenate kinase
MDLGITVSYNPPESVGADRLCNAVSAFEKYGGPVIIVDFGTATTIDVISAKGIYTGGAIAPGLELATLSLVERTSKLHKIPLEFPSFAIGKTTEESMQSGVMYGSVKMVDGLIGLFKEELDEEPKVVATGGLANVISPKSDHIQYIEPNLVLDGLIRIYDRNRRVS